MAFLDITTLLTINLSRCLLYHEIYKKFLSINFLPFYTINYDNIFDFRIKFYGKFYQFKFVALFGLFYAF